MLAPVTFFPGDHNAIKPYAIAPWAEEQLSPDVRSMLTALRGDWFCSAFGENVQSHEGRSYPPHGETANLEWNRAALLAGPVGSWHTLDMNLPIQGGRCEATTALLEGHSIVYQRHDLSGLTGPLNPGHHATLAFPDSPGCGRLSFSPLRFAQTLFEPMERPERGGYCWLEPNAEIKDMQAVPCIDGSTTDLSCFPARRGYEDIVILCADPDLDFAWSAVAFPEQGYVWFALRDPRQLASTMLWFSNGGRHYPPWNGRHINVMGIEDITAFFHVGIAASCQPNLLTERGIKTCLEPDAQGNLSIPYIQGVARIPPGFDRVASITPHPSSSRITLTSDSGIAVETLCQIDFLKTGTLPQMEFA